MKTQIFVLFLAIFISASASSSQVFCGRKLANTLAYFCPAETMKRSGPLSSEDYEGFDLSWLAPKTDALVTKAKRGGVVSECCEKPCSLEELLTYC
ncbi:hypothetical protein ABMA28_004303 [Loxostege sticticalis]|uniref:Insulin-like domain-containing protein n=1 Tax=Loxostege sticticalis TaxID=481309 RepID=A0ABD0SQQ3_LOXSC